MIVKRDFALSGTKKLAFWCPAYPGTTVLMIVYVHIQLWLTIFGSVKINTHSQSCRKAPFQGNSSRKHDSLIHDFTFFSMLYFEDIWYLRV
jgi:hypothetical protein